MERLQELAKAIKRRRMTFHYTQSDVAELTGLTDRTVRAIEGGSGGTAVQSWIKILDVLGLEIKVQIKSLNHEKGQGIL